MTVKELIELLSQEKPETLVVLDDQDREYTAAQGAGLCLAHDHGDGFTFTHDSGPGCEEVFGKLISVFRISLGG